MTNVISPIRTVFARRSALALRVLVSMRLAELPSVQTSLRGAKFWVVCRSDSFFNHVAGTDS